MHSIYSSNLNPNWSQKRGLMLFTNIMARKFTQHTKGDFTLSVKEYFRPDLHDALCAEKKRKIIINLKPKLVLDAGCGNGWLSLAAHEKGFCVVAIDISTKAIKEYRLNEGKKNDVFFVRASLASLPFRNHAFDSVMCADVLEHIIDLVSALSAIHSVLKSEGRFCISLPNGLNSGLFYERITFSDTLKNMRLLYDTSKAKALLIEGLPTEQKLADECGHVQMLTTGNLKQLLIKVGFEIKEWQNVGFVYSYIRSFVRGLGIYHTFFEKILASDLNLSRHLPSVIGENWVIICNKQQKNPES